MKKRVLTIGLVFALVFGLAGIAAAGLDFGKYRDQTLANLSQDQFGFKGPLANSSTAQVTKKQAKANPLSLFTLAKGLNAHVVSTDVAPIADQITLWPNDRHPTWLMACNETEDPSEPGLQRVNLATGQAYTIVSGTEDCDPTRITPWGTIIFGEEDGTEGRTYELIDPLHTTGVTLDRDTGVFSGGVGADNLVTRTALGQMAFEGYGILPNGVTYADPDDSGLGPKNGGPGDSYFKFIPDTLWSRATRRSRAWTSRRSPAARGTGSASVAARRSRATARAASSGPRTGCSWPAGATPTWSSRAWTPA